MSKSTKKDKHSHKESKSGKVKKHKKDSKKHKKDSKKHKKDKKNLDTHNTISADLNTIDTDSQQQSTTNLPTKRSLAPSTDLPRKNPIRKTSAYTSNSDSDSTDNEDKHSTTKPVLNMNKVTSIKVNKNNSSEDNTKRTTSSKGKVNMTTPVQEKKPTATKKYSSDSDSDSTDEDSRRTAPRATPTKKTSPASVRKAAPVKKYASDSDSDSTDNDTTPSKETPIKKTPPVKKSTSANNYISDSDSDSTDNDTRAPATSSRKTASGQKASSTKHPVNDSSDNNAQKPTKKASVEGVRLGPKKYRTSEIVDSGDSDSSNDDHRTNPSKVASALVDGSDSDSSVDNRRVFIPVFLERKQIKRDTNKGEFSNNRLQYSLAYRDKTRDTKKEYMRRFVDEADKYTVTNDFFISDSESESDSGDDYSGTPAPWHQVVLNGTVAKKKASEEQWATNNGRITRIENIRLEKRIKKICRRENKTLEDFRDLLDQDFSPNKLFWQKIAKAWPDRTMSTIIRACRRKYNAFAFPNSPWTSEMDQELIEYMKIHGSDYKAIEQKMKRSREDLQTRAVQLLRPEKRRNKTVAKFTDEQKQDLAEAVAANTNRGKVSWPSVAEAYNRSHPDDKRTYSQCQMEWRKRNTDKEMTPAVKLSIIEAIRKGGWKKETDIVMGNIADQTGYNDQTIKRFYLKARATIPDYEKKDLPEIVDILDQRFTAMVRSLED